MAKISQDKYIAEEVYTEIGKIAVLWSKLEVLLEYLILDIQCIPHETGLVITSELSYRGKYNLIQTFFNDEFDRKKSRSQSLLSTAK